MRFTLIVRSTIRATTLMIVLVGIALVMNRVRWVADAFATTGCNRAVVRLTSSRSAVALSADEECALKPRNAFKECVDCPEMVVVPAGSFIMGSPENETDRGRDEGPQHRVTFATQFAVARFAVTFAEWDASVADGGCNAYKPSDQAWGRDRRPVVNVSWDDATAYI
jgi:formylglycine-generating enzyme required for sulfatase activity